MARSTRKAHDCRKPNTCCNYILMQMTFFLKTFSLSYIIFICQSMFQMWLSFATAFTSAYKSSDWIQNIIQIHDDLPLLTTVPTTILSKVIIYKVAQRQNTVWMNFWVLRGKGGQTLEHLLYYVIQNWEVHDCLAIQSTMANGY